MELCTKNRELINWPKSSTQRNNSAICYSTSPLTLSFGRTTYIIQELCPMWSTFIYVWNGKWKNSQRHLSTAKANNSWFCNNINYASRYFGLPEERISLL